MIRDKVWGGVTMNCLRESNHEQLGGGRDVWGRTRGKRRSFITVSVGCEMEPWREVVRIFVSASVLSLHYHT